MTNNTLLRTLELEAMVAKTSDTASEEFLRDMFGELLVHAAMLVERGTPPAEVEHRLRSRGLSATLAASLAEGAMQAAKRARRQPSLFSYLRMVISAP